MKEGLDSVVTVVVFEGLVFSVNTKEGLEERLIYSFNGIPASAIDAFRELYVET